MTAMNKADLASDINDSYPDNTSGQITPSDLRLQQQNVVDSVLVLDNDASLQVVASPVSIPDLQEKYDLVLAAESTATSQQPGATDTPLQIEFGPAQFTGSDPVQISVAGLLTFNDVGKYFVETEFNVGRTGTSGASQIIVGWKKNGTWEAISGATLVDIADARYQFKGSAFVEPAAAEQWTFFVIRDSAGDNSGGLFLTNPTLAGVPNSPSARIKVWRYQ